MVAVIIRLRQNVITLGAFGSPEPTTQKRTRRTQKLLRKLVLRISLYALIPLITQGGWYVSEIIMQFEHRLVGIIEKFYDRMYFPATQKI